MKNVELSDLKNAEMKNDNTFYVLYNLGRIFVS